MITSTNNQQMKNISTLLKKSKERKVSKSFVVEGPRMVIETPVDKLKAVYVAEGFSKNIANELLLEEIWNKCKQANVTYEVVADQVFKSVSDTQTPQGIMAVVAIPEYELDELLEGKHTHLLILESIQDPGNLGTMVRTGEGAGVTGIIMNKTTVDLFNPKTIRSTMGSIYRVPYFVTENLTDIIQKLKNKGISIYAAHLKGELSYDEKDYTKACGFLIGNEGNGLSDEIAGLADEYIKIPMEGQVESLNAAISATLLMYETNRQRRNHNNTKKE